MEINVRKGQIKDLPAIYKLVEELAIFEKEPEAVTASLQDYTQSFTEGEFDFIVAEDKSQRIVGMALYYLTFSTWKGRMLYLEDFVITQTYRRQGIGQLLFEGVLAQAKYLNCILLKWQVLDWNQSAIDFYLKNNALIEKDWWNGKIFINEK